MVGRGVQRIVCSASRRRRRRGCAEIAGEVDDEFRVFDGRREFDGLEVKHSIPLAANLDGGKARG